MKPVAVSAASDEYQKRRGVVILGKESENDLPTLCATLSLSAGLLRSLKPAVTRAHFAIGAQKTTVFGPGYDRGAR